ncbi:MAG: amidohydrolase family protein [Armatimonadota bacterium]
MLIDSFTLFGSWPGLPYDHPIEHLISGLEHHKLDRACTLSTKGIFFDAAAGNQETWTVCQQDARLIPIGVADPRVGGEEQVRYCQSQGFKVMAMFPGTQGWSVSNVMTRRMLRFLDEAGLPVMIEAGSEGDATKVLEALQGLTLSIIFLDVSLYNLAEAMTIVQMRPNTYLSTRLLCGGDTIESLVQSVGVDKLIFSSRFPTNCFSSAFLTAKFAMITDADRTAIMGGNMERLLA